MAQRGVLFLVAALLSPILSYAQTVAVAQISGVVRDESGGVLPGVEVTATHTPTGTSRFAITGTGGEFVLPNLPVGPYIVDATLPGFAGFKQMGLTLEVGATAVVNITMKVGTLEETLTVTAGATTDRDSQHRGRHRRQQRADGGIAAGRAAAIATRAAGRSRGDPAGGPHRQPASVPVGGRHLRGRRIGNSTIYLVDGAYNNDPVNNIGQPMPFPDALQEFKVETGVRPARYGIYTGATVNAVTKSGTNSFHGTLFEFLRIALQ